MVVIRNLYNFERAN